jgi:7-cyano-7-deazaguanine synthase in queuosine biosynthesis
VPVFVKTGNAYQDIDLDIAQRLMPGLEVYELPKLKECRNGVVPHRNAILLAYLANVTYADEIVVSAPKGEMIWDQQTSFHRIMESVLKEVKISNPLRKLTKAQAIRKYLERNGDVGTLLSTRSCYSGQVGQCGLCAACIKRWIALRNNGLSECYANDVASYAAMVIKSGRIRDMFRYGLRPTFEAVKAFYV